MVYYFGKTVVSDGKEPLCKVCGHKLSYKKIYGQKMLITGCSNEKCIGYKTKSTNTKILISLGEDALKEKKENFRQSRITCKEYWMLKGHSEEEAKEIVKKIQSNASKMVKNRGTCNKKLMEKKLGAVESEKFFRKKSRFCLEYWTDRGYSEDEAKKQISALQSKFGNMQDLEHIKERSYRCKEYWMTRSGMTEDEAVKKVSELQANFSKEKCIEKYGKENGIEVWNARQKKWQESLHKSQNLHVGYSKVSQDLFNELLLKYNDVDKDYVFFGSKNHEYCLRHDDVNYIYDFTDLSKRKIIEFNGDIYHGNPYIFESSDSPNPFKKDKTCKDLWEFDNKKRNVALLNGFDELIIWESEYRNNKDDVIKKCIDFLEL